MIYPVRDPVFINGLCFNITQYFGENVNLYGGKGHSGVDFVYWDKDHTMVSGKFSYGKDLLAVADARVIRVIWNDEHSFSGNGVILETDKYHVVYWHMCRIDVVEDQLVKEGDVIGGMGNNGFVFPTPNLSNEDPNDDYFGTHLHLEIKEHINGIIQNVDNGFGGAINPLPLLTGKIMNLYLNEKTGEQYVECPTGTLHRIANVETLDDLDSAGIIIKEGVVPITNLSVYKMGNVWLSYNDQ